MVTIYTEMCMLLLILKKYKSLYISKTVTYSILKYSNSNKYKIFYWADWYMTK